MLMVAGVLMTIQTANVAWYISVNVLDAGISTAIGFMHMKRLSDRVSDRITDSLGWLGPVLIVVGLVLFAIAHLWK